ncbi:hypothetical protein DFJ74DRAFT_705949 [Hyaloraphidium curvatum]|nr:hypothetical protein DFJ74DRAFT_705949 [Hyaloraphidium curvatum]
METVTVMHLIFDSGASEEYREFKTKLRAPVGAVTAALARGTGMLAALGPAGEALFRKNRSATKHACANCRKDAGELATWCGAFALEARGGGREVFCDVVEVPHCAGVGRCRAVAEKLRKDSVTELLALMREDPSAPSGKVKVPFEVVALGRRTAPCEERPAVLQKSRDIEMDPELASAVAAASSDPSLFQPLQQRLWPLIRETGMDVLEPYQHRIPCANCGRRPVDGATMYSSVPDVAGGPVMLYMLPECGKETCSSKLTKETADMAMEMSSVAARATPSKQAQHLGSACGRCGRVSTDPKVDFKRCARCKKAHYCSERCQKEDWALHKNFCNVNSR